jgi:hypothetical protein
MVLEVTYEKEYFAKFFLKTAQLGNSQGLKGFPSRNKNRSQTTLRCSLERDSIQTSTVEL